MGTRAEVNALLRALFRDVAGMPENSIRPANQNAPVGDGLFGTVNIIAMDGTQWAARKLEDDPESVDLLETVRKDVTITVSVQFFRAGAHDSLHRLVHLLQSSAGIDKMQAVGVGFVSAGRLRDLTTMIDTYYEERAQADLTFNINALYITNIRSILTAVYAVHFEDGFSQNFELELNR